MIRRRIWLVTTLVLGQTVVLSAGLAVYHQRLTHSLAASIREQIFAANRTLAEQLSHLINARQMQTIEPGTADWQWLQSVTEQIRLPNDGFVCVVDGDGRLVCHPELQRNPDLIGMPIGHTILNNNDGARDTSTIMDAIRAGESGEVVTGRIDMGSGTQLIGGTSLANADASILVHQRESGVRQTVQQLSSRVLWVGIPVALLILLSTGVTTWLIMRRYESRLEAANAGLEDEVARRTADLTNTRDAVIFGLAKLSESRDTDTGDHLNRIHWYVKLLARQLREDLPALRELITDQWINDLALGSVLHDIGKVGVPDQILLKPGMLTDDEYERMKHHTWMGGETLFAIEKRLGESNFLTLAREIAFAHHERWDGNGYPFGLHGQIIPLSARIVALADVYDAVTSKRPYKPAYSHEQALRIIREGAGTQFDPDVVAAFEKVEHLFNERRAMFQDDQYADVIGSRIVL